MNDTEKKELTFICMSCKLELKRSLLEAIKLEERTMIPYCQNCSEQAFIEDLKSNR